MLGAIAGDIIGSVYEAMPIKHKMFPLFSATSRFTDDTVLTVAVADCLLNRKGYTDTFYAYVSKYPNAGYGGTFLRWALSKATAQYDSWGNGSAMRVNPVGWVRESEPDVLDAFRSEFMPYHAAAVGHQWAAVDPAYQILILALMRALGGMEVALALGIVALTLKPFREGAAWATWSIAALGLIATAGSLTATMNVAAQTPGNPPVGAVAAWGALILVSLVLSLVGGRGAGSAASDHA